MIVLLCCVNREGSVIQDILIDLNFARSVASLLIWSVMLVSPITVIKFSLILITRRQILTCPDEEGCGYGGDEGREKVRHLQLISKQHMRLISKKKGDFRTFCASPQVLEAFIGISTASVRSLKKANEQLCLWWAVNA